jgi:hypothetical protein
MSQLKNGIAEELANIQQAHGGMLRPVDVVAFAKQNKRSALHGQFEWDDTKAAEQFRLVQARYIIRLAVVVIGEDAEPVRALVSLTTDRPKGGGYRSIESVLADDDEREQLMNDALLDLNRAKRRYAALTKLQPVWDALDRVQVQAERKAKKKAA